MPDLDQLMSEGSTDEDEPTGYEAVVARDAVLGEPLKVRIDAFDDGKHLFPAIGWAPRAVPGSPVTTLLPQEGDRALVTASDQGETWCLAWEPA